MTVLVPLVVSLLLVEVGAILVGAPVEIVPFVAFVGLSSLFVFVFVVVGIYASTLS